MTTIVRSRVPRAARTIAVAAVMTVSGATLISTSSAVPAHAVSTVSSASGVSFSAGGTTSTYSIYANGVDPSEAVGAMYYFGGDYWSANESEVLNPRSTTLASVASVAASKNMILVVPVTPDKDGSGDGYTWWQDMNTNGAWFRALRADLTARYGLDTGRTWFTGYSGGAEFISYEVLTDNQNWITGGGATIIGGGGADGGLRFTTAPSATVKALDVNWHAGSLDVAGNTNPPQWSGLGAAREGQAAYQKAGFTNTSLEVIPGADHYHYDYAGLTTKDMADVPAAPSKNGTTPTPVPSTGGYVLKNGIKAGYDATGGVSKYGAPTSNEMQASGGGVYQTFANSGWRFYWSQSTGAVPIDTKSYVGAAYANTGYSSGWGLPKTVLKSLGGDHAYQDFVKTPGTSSVQTIRAMRGPTGVYTITLSSPMGKAWMNAGYERGWGYPAGVPYAVAGGTSQKFSNGYTATCNHSTGVVTAVKR